MPGLLLNADPSTRPLSEVARHVVFPEGIVDSVWFDLLPRFNEWGDSFDAWQDGLGQIMLGLRADGKYAATVGGEEISIPRQVAKTFLVGRIAFGLSCHFDDTTVLWTAHRTRTATQTFQKLAGFAQRKAVRKYLKADRSDGIRSTNGEQEIRFRNGSSILFGAREQGFGRGFDEVDVEVFDEAQILTEKALEDMVPATNQSRNPHGALLIFMGTPPRPVDPGEVFSMRRAKALEGKPDGVVMLERGNALYVECSADPNVGRPGGPSLDDRDQLRKANPSYPHRTPEESIARMRENLPSEDSWRREGLGVHDEAGSSSRAVSELQWADSAVDEAPEGLRAFAVAFNLDGDRLALGGARKHDDGVHVEIIDALEDDRGVESGLGALADWFCERDEGGTPRWRKSSGIALSGRSGAPALAQLLRDRRVPDRWIFLPSTPKYLEACSMWLEGMRGGTITHLAEGQDVLDDSIAVTDVDKRGGLSATSIDGDDTPTEAVALAHWVARTSPLGPKRTTERKAVFL